MKSTDENIEFIEQKAKELRKNILTMIYSAQSGHPGGSLSAADLMATLYFEELNIRPDNPQWENRDRFVLSKGHVCPSLYSCLVMRNYIPDDAIYTLRKEGSIFQGHPDMKRCPGVDISTGSLGQGLSAAVGMALAGKRDGKTYRVFCLIGDGESQEGQIWEAVQSAVKYHLDNLIIIVDNNGLQNDSSCEEVMPLGNLVTKFSAFGCKVESIDGHSILEIRKGFTNARNNRTGKPHCIIAKTIKGKGVSFMENIVAWHGTPPNETQFKLAIAEIEGEL
jgi:transketolase